MSRTAWRVTTPPAAEWITLNDLKGELGIPTADTSQDARLTRTIKATREAAEAYTNRAFLAQTIRLQLDTFPTAATESAPWWDGVRQGPVSLLTGNRAAAPIYLPRPPMLELIGVAIITPDGTPDTIDLTTLTLDDVSEPARLFPLDTWPATRTVTGVTITYRAGYGPNASDLPAAMIDAMLSHIKDVQARPSGAITSERIDNAATTYATAANDGTPGSGDPFGLRSDARNTLEPYRVRDLGFLHSPYA